MISGKESQELFRQACANAAGDPDHVPMIDLTLPEDKSPTEAERASWRRSEAA